MILGGEYMETLKKYRTNIHYSYRTMGSLLNISKTYYWQLEHKHRRLSYDMAVQIANIFKVRPDILFYNELKNEKYQKRKGIQRNCNEAK